MQKLLGYHEEHEAHEEKKKPLQRGFCRHFQVGTAPRKKELKNTNF